MSVRNGPLSPAFTPYNPKRSEDANYQDVRAVALVHGRELPAGHEEAWREGFQEGWREAIELYEPEILRGMKPKQADQQRYRAKEPTEEPEPDPALQSGL